MVAELTPEERTKLERLRSDFEQTRTALKPLTDWTRASESDPMPQDVATANKQLDEALKTYFDQRNAVIDAAEIRYMQAVGTNPADVLLDGKRYIQMFVTREYSSRQLDPAGAQDMDALKRILKLTLERHFDALKESPDMLRDLQKFADEALRIVPTGKVNAWASRPESYQLLADNITRAIFNADAETGDGLTPLGGKKFIRKRQYEEIRNILQISFDDLGKGIKIRRNLLKDIDEPIFNAILTLFIKGNYDVITPLQIHRLLTADPEARITIEKAAEYIAAAERMARCWIDIDATPEIKALYPELDKWRHKGHLLPIEIIDIEMGGVRVQAIQRGHVPILYRYAAMKNQISTIPLKMLATPGSDTDEKTVLNHYLLKQIEAMKKGKLTPVVLYKTLYDQIAMKAETPGAVRKKQFKIREQAKAMLTYWVDQGNIKGFSERKKAHTFDALLIEV